MMITEKEFKESRAWGLSCMVNLYNCNPELVRSSEHIKKFAEKLCDFIEMKRFGEPQVVHFGDDPKVSGYSMTQLIETSLVSAHFVEETNNIYVDVFSCKYYAPKDVRKFCSKYFEASTANFKYELRI